MSLHNTVNSYGTVTKTFHWLTALLILGVIVTGTVAHDLATGDPEALAWKIRLYSVHKTLGLTIFFTALLRIVWAISQPKPGMIGGHGGMQGFLAELVHWALYAALVLVPLTGWMTHAATEGFAPIKWPFGQDLPFIPNDPALAERLAIAHGFFEKTLLAALALHVAGALKHHVWDRDPTLRRMWFGRPALPDVVPHPPAVLPALVAGTVFVGVGIAAALWPADPGEEVVALEEVASEWRVLDGRLQITVDQFGTDVTGEFADWTAAISFNPDAPGEIKGGADVTIAIGSLSLGNVTADALAPDFLSAKAFPNAKVTGDIIATDAAYELRGTLTLRGQEMPLTLPFDLTLEGDMARASGQVTLQRLDFNIGESMADESNVGFGVVVQIDLQATNAPPGEGAAPETASGSE